MALRAIFSPASICCADLSQHSAVRRAGRLVVYLGRRD
jgi:hypothetical protein